MKYEIDYRQLEEPEKTSKALQDVREFLGEEHDRLFGMLVRNEEMNKEALIMVQGMFLGIEGFPAAAWADHILAARRARQMNAELPEEGREILKLKGMIQ